MPLDLSRRRLIATTAATGTLLAVPRLAGAQAPMKVGFVYVGPVGDYGWTYQHDVGREEVQGAYIDRIQTSFVENVSEGPDAERVIRQLATTGHQLIFTTSFGFMNATEKVARQFPQVNFEHCTGYKRLDNLATYDARFYQGRAVIGTIAGHLTQTGKIGYLGSFPIPEVVQGINSFTLAMHKVKPDAEVNVVWVNSWYDPGKEADAARALFDQGADIIVQHTDSPAALQVAEERGLMGFGQSSNMAKFAPNAQLTAIVDHWAPYYVERVGKALDGTWKSGAVWGGLASGMVQIAPYGPKVPENVQQAANEVIEGIKAGTFHPFKGPITDQKGNTHGSAGQALSDEELVAMDWYVPGVNAGS